jgi:hypothetical protein
MGSVNTSILSQDMAEQGKYGLHRLLKWFAITQVSAAVEELL